MGRRKKAADGTANLRIMPKETEFLRSTLVHWMLTKDVDKRYSDMSKDEILELEKKLIEFTSDVKESA